VTGRRTIVIAIVVLAGLGVADATYLTVLKAQQEIQGYADSQVCRQLSAQGCAIALESGPSSIGPIPVSLVAVATYVVVAGLAVLLLLGRVAVFGPAAVLLISLGAVMWSAGLAWYSYSRGSWCPFCIGLYGVNLGLLISACLLVKSDPFRSIGPSLRSVFSAPAALALTLIATVGISLGGYGIMTAAVKASSGERSKRDAQRLEAAITGGLFEVTLTGIPMVGPADAPLTLIKMSDFECPYCGKFWAQVEEFRRRHPKLIRVGFINHPLAPECNPMMNGPFHVNACRAAYAAWCAHQQGKFWEMGEEMFSNQHALSSEDIVEYAKEIGLNVPAFDVCIAAPETRSAVEMQALFARSVGASGTPASLINGLLFGGAMDVVSLKALSRVLPNRLSQGTPKPGRLKTIADEALAGGKVAVEPSPRGLGAAHVKRLEMVAFLNPARETDRGTLEAVTTMSVMQPHHLRASFRTAAPENCATDFSVDSLDEECLGARLLICSLAATSPKIPIVMMARHAGPLSEVVEEIRKISAPVGDCLDTGIFNGASVSEALIDDRLALKAAGVGDELAVFVDGYRLSGRPDIEVLDAFVARIQLDRRR
jgi:protein-disulfide isomerase